jgi:hypothetical protein
MRPGATVSSLPNELMDGRLARGLTGLVYNPSGPANGLQTGPANNFTRLELVT